MEVFGLDRDGVILKSPSFRDGHPRNVHPRNIPKKIDPVVRKWVESHPAVLISNQNGAIKNQKTVTTIFSEFEKILKIVPFKAAFFSFSNEGKECCGILIRRKEIITRDISFSSSGYYRKPSIGMGKEAHSNGFSLIAYIGDKSGIPNWANGDDSDQKFAENLSLPYWDVKEFFPNAMTRCK